MNRMKGDAIHRGMDKGQYAPPGSAYCVRLDRSREAQDTYLRMDRLAILSAVPVGTARLTTVVVEVTSGRVVQSSSASDGLRVGLALKEDEAEG